MIYTFLSGSDLVGVVAVLTVFTGLILLAFAASRYLFRRLNPSFSDDKTFLYGALSVLVLFPTIIVGLTFFIFFVMDSYDRPYPDSYENVPIVYQPGDSCNITFSGIQFSRMMNNAVANLKTEEGKLILEGSAGSDYFNSPDRTSDTHTAPILLTKVDNTQPFTFTTKLTPAHNATYDAGAIYVFYDDYTWHKFAFEQDERGRHRIVTVRTMGVSDDNNHDILTESSVYLKISSDMQTIGFYYSLDNVTWNLARLHHNEYPMEIWLGVSSQSPMGNGNYTVFEACSLVKASVSDFRTGI